jgi:Dihydrouridine synthase (Dus)
MLFMGDISRPVAYFFSHHAGFAMALSTQSPSEANSKMQSELQHQMILAPLTLGGSLPFRRLCADFGTNVSTSDMVYARFLLQGDSIEKARLRIASKEHYFGVQIATNDIYEKKAAMKVATVAGTDFVDLNCGCTSMKPPDEGWDQRCCDRPPSWADWCTE